MTETNNNRTCDYANCSQTNSPMVRDFSGLYCRTDHSAAGCNEWAPEDCEEWVVECDGYETMFLAPTKKKAQSQWESHVRVSDHPHSTQPKIEDTE